MTTRRSRSPKPPTDRPRPGLHAVPAVVRLPRVRAAQKRIASGWYERDDVKDSLARAVLAVLLRD